MIRKIVIGVFIIAICFSFTWAFQDELKIQSNETPRLDIFKKLFAKLDSIFHISKADPPSDTARIFISVYPPIPETEVTTDYQHRIGAYEAWRQGDYRGIIDSLKMVTKPIDVDWRLSTNSYYRLKKIDLALEAGEKIQNPDRNTLYSIIN